MIDIQYVRDNPDLVQEKSKQKGYEIDIQKLLARDEQRREVLQTVENLRAQRNEIAEKMKQSGGKPDPEAIEEGKRVKVELAEREGYLETCEAEWSVALKAIPNMPLDDVPVGLTEEENVVTKEVGDIKEFNFEPKTHWQIGEERDWIDKERAVKIAGSRFAYLKGELVLLQMAIVQYVMSSLSDEQLIQKLIAGNNLSLSAKPFTPILPPAMLKTEPYVASARLNAEEVTYKLADDDLWLNASAEHTLCTMYWNEILPKEQLPIRYIGYSASFRREAGTYGKDTEGIIRMHQFDKLEMEVFSSAETGLEEHKLLIAIQEHLVSSLGLPYRFIQKCTFDIGKPNARGIDIDVWFPGQKRYIETHTADYMTDYQARDLKTRVRATDGSLDLVHTNDATAFALGRIMAAILENYQTADGKVVVPEVLRPYLAGREIL